VYAGADFDIATSRRLINAKVALAIFKGVTLLYVSDGGIII